MPPGLRERVAVIRALLAAVDAELDQIAEYQPSDTRVYLHDQLWRKYNGVCPECLINWDLPSPTCPKIQYNRHPVG